MKDIRNQIASEYPDAVKQGNEKRGLVSRTGSASFASYSAEELKHLPEEAVDASFGCGNPVAFSSVQSGQTVLDLGCGARVVRPPKQPRSARRYRWRLH